MLFNLVLRTWACVDVLIPEGLSNFSLVKSNNGYFDMSFWICREREGEGEGENRDIFFGFDLSTWGILLSLDKRSWREMGYVYDHARARASDLSGFPRNARETIGILGSRSQILRGFFLRPFFPFFFLFFFFTRVSHASSWEPLDIMRGSIIVTGRNRILWFFCGFLFFLFSFFFFFFNFSTNRKRI